MAFPQFDAASQGLFVAGPNGYPIPKALAPNFNLPEPPPVGPPPTFDPGELAPPPDLAPAPPVAPPNAAAAFQNASRQFNAPAPASNDNTLSPFGAPDQGAPLTPELAPPPKPQTGTEMQQGALAERARIAGQVGDVESEGARKKAAALDQQVIDEDKAEKDRAAIREREQKEVDYARAQQNQAMDAYVNHKVDQNRLWHNMSTGHKIMAGIGLVMGGLGGALAAKNNGGKVINPAIDIIQKAIDDDVRLQLADRDKLGQVAQMKRTAVGDLTSQFKDREAQYDAVRAGNRQRVANQLDAIAAKIQDPVKKLQAQDAAAQLTQSAGVIADQAQQRELDNRRADQQMAISRGQLGVAQGQLGLQRTAQKRADEQFEFEKGWKAAEFAQDNAKNLLTAQKNALAVNKGLSKEDREAQKDALEQKIKLNERTVYDADGKPLQSANEKGDYLARDASDAKALQAKISNATKLVRMADELVRLREQHGWSSDLVKSPEFRKMRQIYSDMQLKEKDLAQLGALSGSDMGMITGVLGTDDPTGMRDPTEGIRAFRNSMVAGLDDDMRTNGIKFDAKSTFPELTQQGVQDAAKDTPVGALNKAAYRNAEPGSYEQFSANAKALERGKPNFENKPTPSGGAATAALMLVGPAANGDKKAKQALDVMAKSGNPEIRKLIGDIAKANPSLGIKVE